MALLIRANINFPLLYAPDPESQSPVDTCIESYGKSCVYLGGFETELIVPVKGRSTDGKRGISQGKADIRENM